MQSTLKQSSYSQQEIKILNYAKLLILFSKYTLSNKSTFKNYINIDEHESYSSLKQFADKLLCMNSLVKHTSHGSSDSDNETTTNFIDKSKVFFFALKHYALKGEDPNKQVQIHDFGERLSK